MKTTTPNQDQTYYRESHFKVEDMETLQLWETDQKKYQTCYLTEQDWNIFFEQEVKDNAYNCIGSWYGEIKIDGQTYFSCKRHIYMKENHTYTRRCTFRTNDLNVLRLHTTKRTHK